MIKLNYKINPKYLNDWEFNRIFIKIDNQKEHDILNKFRKKEYDDYRNCIIFYSKESYSSYKLREQTLKIYHMDVILFSEFFNLNDYQDIINDINTLEHIYNKINDRSI